MQIVAPHPARALATGLALCLALMACGAAAATKPAHKAREKAAPSAAKPALIGSYGDWSVFQSQSGKNRICYTLAQPKDRQPADLKRDAAYAFISERPAEGVRNEVSFIMGFDVGSGPAASDAKERKKEKRKKESEVVGPTAVIGDASFDLLPKGADLWVKNAAREGELITEMRKGSKLVIKASSKKGNVTTDTYSLSGFKQAIDRALKDCPGT